MAENKTVDKEKYLDEIEDSIRTIGVLTSGGDAPGMNAAIRAVVRRALAKGLKVRGIRRGYHGLLKEEIIDMSARDVSDIIERGGTVLQTARCKTMRTEEGQQKAAAICKKYGIDGLVVIGGDGSFAGAQKLANLGVNTIGIPGTIDLDIACTDYTIGFDTAVNTAMEAIDKVRDTSTSHERCSVIEVMGRDAGYLALWCGIANGAEKILMPEEKDYDEKALIKDILENKKRGKKNYIIINAEGVGDSINMAKSDGVKGVSGRFISRLDMDFNKFKEVCAENGIQMTSFESQMDFGEFNLNADGLIPVIVQDYKTNEVLMMAYMNEEAFEHTVKTGRMTYYSRSRKCQWIKGETSGHFQYVKSLAIDCDRDTMLAKVEQIGAACHTGNRSCFYTTIVGNDYDAKNPVQIFESVYQTIADRKENPKEGSYTNYLFEKGLDKILKKVGEEATEVVIAAKNPNVEEVKYELSDFLYHAMVLMVEKGITWEDITGELADR